MVYDKKIQASLGEKISGKPKPYIDKNLQLQVPDLEGPEMDLASRPPESVFSHFCRDNAHINELTYMETELNAAITEAQKTFEAWKKMQSKLAKLTKEVEK